FQVADPVQTPANNQVSCGVVYEHTGNTVIATTLYQTITPPIQTPISLYDYAAIAHNNVLMKGITVNVAASGQPPVNILCDGSSSTRADLGLLALFGQVNPTGTKTWVDNNNISTIITGLQCISLATQIGEWIDNTYVILGQILASISATYTGTTEQIDKIVWPTS
ncbi:MAG: hypothetical protein P4L79_11135, partial [Legionella sp.]|uniref:hypothetical protein n=1 Tax=Legionella sp. TaxID=459 RepID=UPI002848109A|nr:hypothetical protein [Legionella sp.]